ncbi:MAG: hypothetical protein JKY95_02300 [Planctomycetaceae bacterium]|nr:hypothetical protein [Planctomycetaceae bacterium]
MNKQSISFWLGCLSLAFFLGCSGPADDSSHAGGAGDDAAHSDEGDDHSGHDHAGHAHPTHGPHKGDLIELGNEEYHGEVVDDHDNGTVTIYILDSAGKNAVPIAAKEIVVNLKHEGKGEQFKLAASPEEGEAEGMSSRFVSTDKEFAEELDHNHGDATLVVTIKGTQYRGKINHDHASHEGHDH